MSSEPPEIPGAHEVVAWFGGWPTFHDAEVLSITLNLAGESRVEIHAFKVTDELDAQGYYVRTKHAIVTFLLDGFPMNAEGITNTRIDFFNHQNVLWGLTVKKVTGGYLLTLDGIFGVDGGIACERISVKVVPGEPPTQHS